MDWIMAGNGSYEVKDQLVPIGAGLNQIVMLYTKCSVDRNIYWCELGAPSTYKSWPFICTKRLRLSRGSVLAFGTQVRGFKPGRSRRIFKGKYKSSARRGAWMFVCCDCCVLSGRGLCDELITRSEESYRLWCVVVCDLKNLVKLRSHSHSVVIEPNRRRITGSISYKPLIVT